MKLAVCFSRGERPHRQTAERMARAQVLFEDHVVGLHEVPGGTLGWVETSERFSKVPLRRVAENGNVLLISGVPLRHGGGLDRALAQVMEADYTQAGRLLSDLEGAFAAVYWDSANRKLVVVTDFFAFQSLYVRRQDGLFMLASEEKGIAAARDAEVEMDVLGWGAFAGWAKTFAERPQLANVERMRAATILVYDPVTDSVERSVYWQWSEPTKRPTLEEVDTGRLVALMADDVRASQEHCPTGTLLLTGGFDSRLVLAILEQVGIEPDIMTVHHEGHYFGAEARYAAGVAQRFAHGRFTTVIPRHDYFSSADYVRFLIASDVSTPSLQLFIPMVASAIQPAMKAVWEGISPGYALKNSPALVPGGFAEYLKHHGLTAKTSRRWRASTSVFRSDLVDEMLDAFLQRMEQERKSWRDESIGIVRCQVSHCIATRIGPNPFAVYGNEVLSFTPGVSREFWRLAGEIPFEVKADHRLIHRIYERHFPKALKVPFCTEKGITSYRVFAPGVWATKALHNLRYYYNRARLRGVGRFLPRWRRPANGTPAPRSVMDRVLERVDPGHADLNADSVRELLGPNGRDDLLKREARRLLFYWQAWHMVMSGELNASNAAEFVERP